MQTSALGAMSDDSFEYESLPAYVWAQYYKDSFEKFRLMTDSSPTECDGVTFEGPILKLASSEHYGEASTIIEQINVLMKQLKLLETKQ